MKKNNSDLFFEELASKWKAPVKIILIGGAAAQIFGVNRSTVDVDFEVALLDKTQAWNEFDAVVKDTEKITGIKAEFSDNIDRWSEISFLDYRKHLHHYKDYQKIKVYILEPGYWSIGKISRYWDSDILDMLHVFKKEKTDPVYLAKLWMQALRSSSPSSQLFNVKKNATHFFITYGKEIWGRKFPEEEIKKVGF